MYGIYTVMENIAFHVSESTSYAFGNVFTHNMAISEEKAKYAKCQKSLKYQIKTRIQKLYCSIF